MLHRVAKAVQAQGAYSGTLVLPVADGALAPGDAQVCHVFAPWEGPEARAGWV